MQWIRDVSSFAERCDAKKVYSFLFHVTATFHADEIIIIIFSISLFLDLRMAIDLLV